MPRIGIVVPVYNAAPFLQETAASIQRQTFADWSCVLVDDGSTDGSGSMCDAIAAGDDRFTVIHQPNAGTSAARNIGSRALPNCEFWSFMDHDDIWHPEALEHLLAAATQPDVVGAHCLAELIDARGERLPGFAAFQRARSRPGHRRFEVLDTSHPTTLESALFVNRVYPPGVVIARAAAYRAAGDWNGGYVAVQDWDMLLRILAQGPLTFIARCLVEYRRHSANLSANHHRSVAETRALHVAAFDRLTPEIGRRTLRKWWRQWERQKLTEAVNELPSPRGMARIAAHTWRYVRAWPSTGPFG